MKIIIDHRQERVADHVRRIHADEERHRSRYGRNLRDAVPLDVPVHQAQYPQRCDECGETYWSTDPYASHLRCPGAPPKQRAGFTND